MENYILVIGSCNYDIIMKQEKFSEIGETVLAKEMMVCGGGKGANQAVQCSKLIKNTIFLGCIGQDEMGNFLMNQLEEAGVCTKYIKRSSLNSGIGIVNCRTDGEVQATVFAGANSDLDKEWISKNEFLFEQAKIVILQLEVPLETVYEAIKLCQKYNCYIILNAAPAKRLELDVLKQIDCLIVNEVEASFYLNEESFTVESIINKREKLLSLVKHCCIVTLGKNGSIIIDKNSWKKIDAKKVKAIETTGAGDSYVGAFATKLYEGSNLIDACTYATLASSFTVQNIGAQSSMPSKSDLEDDEYWYQSYEEKQF